MGAHFQKSKVSHLYLHTETGIYYARARNAAGRDVWRSLQTASFSIAREKLLPMVALIRGGATKSLTTRDITNFSQVVEIYQTRVKTRTDLKPRSIQYRLETVDALLRSWPELYTLPIRLVTVDACLAWASAYRQKFSETRFNNTVDSLRHILEIAKEYGLITANPAARIGKVKVSSKKLQLPREAGGWCSQEAADLVEFLAYSGCRITEAGYIKWADVDGAAGTIRIHGHEKTGTKSSESRSIPITPPMRDLLDRLSAKDSQPRAVHRRGAGYILQIADCYRALGAACKKAGIERLGHHSLRHLFATRCIEAGVDIPTVSRWLGHKDGGALALKVYGHLRDQHSQEMAAKVTFNSCPSRLPQLP